MNEPAGIVTEIPLSTAQPPDTRAPSERVHVRVLEGDVGEHELALELAEGQRPRWMVLEARCIQRQLFDEEQPGHVLRDRLAAGVELLHLGVHPVEHEEQQPQLGQRHAQQGDADVEREERREHEQGVGRHLDVRAETSLPHIDPRGASPAESRMRVDSSCF